VVVSRRPDPLRERRDTRQDRRLAVELTMDDFSEAKEQRMIVIHCRFRIPPDARDAWTESARRIATLSRAEKGCLAYDFSFDILDPDIAYAYEAWESQELLNAHITAPHHIQRAHELEQWTIDYQEITFYGVAWERDVLAERQARRAPV